MSDTNSFIQLIKHPVKGRMFLFWKLPSAFFSGVRVKFVDEMKAEVTVPYKWFSQNPFKSTYFACLAMAAEMSTGILALMNIYNRKPAVSVLVTKLEANYLKKATGITTFTCLDGEAIRNTINEAAQTGEAKTFRATSVGKNKDEELIAEFFITWSFKVKLHN